jgi:hypothetical protein
MTPRTERMAAPTLTIPPHDETSVRPRLATTMMSPGPRPGDGAGEDMRAAVLRARLAGQWFEFDGHRVPGHLGPAPHRPQPALARREPAGVQGIRHGGRVQRRELCQQDCFGTHALQ